MNSAVIVGLNAARTVTDGNTPKDASFHALSSGN